MNNFGFVNPFMPQYQATYQPQSALSAQKYEIIRVNGRNGAEALQMAPNSQALLLDEGAPVVWLVMTDGAGYKTVTGYDIIPAQTQEQKDADRYTALENRIAALEGIVNEQSNPRNVKSKSAVKSDSAD